VKKKAPRGKYLEAIARRVARPESDPPHLTPADLVQICPELNLRIAAGDAGRDRPLTTTRVQLLGLALQGLLDDLEPGSVQILGRAELRFIREQTDATLFEPAFASGIGCMLVPDAPASLSLPPAFLRLAENHRVPVFYSARKRQQVEVRVAGVLEEQLAPSVSFHGDLVVFSGLGLLIIGKSGIGKSDCALDLITHGHQLVADDVVLVRRNPLGQLIGRARDLIRHHMDIRGLGIVNVRELLGVYYVMEEHRIDRVVFLAAWHSERNYASFERSETLNILGVPKPLLPLPVAPGRNWENLIQVAVRNHILKSKGYDAEQRLAEKLDTLLARTGE